jgi:hypothetical protein
MTPEKTREHSFKIIDLLPDAPDEAMAVLALTFANVTCSTGCTDQAAINAFRIALRQMRASKHWVDA